MRSDPEIRDSAHASSNIWTYYFINSIDVSYRLFYYCYTSKTKHYITDQHCISDKSIILFFLFFYFEYFLFQKNPIFTINYKKQTSLALETTAAKLVRKINAVKIYSFMTNINFKGENTSDNEDHIRSVQ